jgi:hypothetical protein
MTTLSKAAQLQQAVLSIAAREGSGLDLTALSAQHAPGDQCLEHGTRPGDRVLLVGASGPLLAVVARQVGADGAVLILERNPAVVAQAQQHEEALAAALGYRNWRYAHTALDDLRTDPAFLERFLAAHPVTDGQSYQALLAALDTQRGQAPLVPEASIDLVILDRSINRLPIAQGRTLLAEAFRVLRRGGRLYASVLLADEPPPAPLPAVNGLAISTVPLETEIMALLEEAGYYGLAYTWRAALPLQVVAGVELRAFVVEAYKGKQGLCLDQGHAVIYRGPWKAVLDDDGHRYVRGERVAVCAKTYALLQRAPYQEQCFGIPAYLEVPEAQAPLFDCTTPHLRAPAVTKGRQSLSEAPCGCAPAGKGCC